jgi:hypothetical protein
VTVSASQRLLDDRGIVIAYWGMRFETAIVAAGFSRAAFDFSRRDNYRDALNEECPEARRYMCPWPRISMM